MQPRSPTQSVPIRTIRRGRVDANFPGQAVMAMVWLITARYAHYTAKVA